MNNKVSKVISCAPVGFSGSIVNVESDINNGLPSFQIVGLGNKAIDEAKERVRSAIKNSLLDFPKNKITINLAPAELPKDGTHYDVPIALAILTSANIINQEQVNNSLFAGELALDGKIRPVKSIITIVEAAKKANIEKVYIPSDNVSQALLINGIDIYPVKNLSELFLHLKGEKEIPVADKKVRTTTSKNLKGGNFLDNIIGQEQAKRALIIAAAGHHNLLLNGPPGAGKTMLAHSLLNLLPNLTKDEQLAVTKIYSMAGESIDEIIDVRPFRAPHHTSSRVALIGGGTRPKPGEVSLAHTGVLFLDEVPEYPRASLESLRQPLEDKTVTITRANGCAVYPADFMLIATMNPCPCGYYGDTKKECSCSMTQLLSYQKRLSGPLLDRIDMHLTTKRVPNELLLSNTQSSGYPAHIAAKKIIENVQSIQYARYKSSVKYNGNLSSEEIKKYVNLEDSAKEILTKAADKMSLSARGYFKVLRIARTIADIENSKTVQQQHITEALYYRSNS